MGEEILGLHQQIARLEGHIAVLDRCIAIRDEQIADLQRRLDAPGPYSSAPAAATPYAAPPVAAAPRRPPSGLEVEEEEVLLPSPPPRPTLSELDAVRRGMREREMRRARAGVGSSSRREQGRRR